MHSIHKCDTSSSRERHDLKFPPGTSVALYKNDLYTVPSRAPPAQSHVESSVFLSIHSIMRKRALDNLRCVDRLPLSPAVRRGRDRRLALPVSSLPRCVPSCSGFSISVFSTSALPVACEIPLAWRAPFCAVRPLEWLARTVLRCAAAGVTGAHRFALCGRWSDWRAPFCAVRPLEWLARAVLRCAVAVMSPAAGAALYNSVVAAAVSAGGVQFVAVTTVIRRRRCIWRLHR